MRSLNNFSKRATTSTSILVVTPYFYPEGGGLENYAYQISKRLVENGHKITVLCSTKGRKESVEDIDGIKVIRLKPHFVVSNTPVKLDLLFFMSKILEKKRFDLINAHTPVPYYADVASWVSMIHKIPLVITYHAPIAGGTIFLDFVAWIVKHTFERVLFHKAKKIIVTSQITKNYLHSFSKKAAIIPPGADLSLFSYSNNNHYRVHTLFIGPLSKSYEYKGLDYLLKAISIVKENVSDISLTVVGQGDLLERYKFICKELGIEKNVKFVGRIPLSDLIDEYHKTDVLILPSIAAEGFGMVLIEANACGKPVIGTRIGGISDFIKDGINGLLVPPRDPEALASAIKKILVDAKFARDMGKAGRRYVEQNFDWNGLTMKTEKIFCDAIRRPNEESSSQ